MVVTKWRKINIVNLVNRLSIDYPTIKFIVGNTFSWSPRIKCIYYNKLSLATHKGQWTLLHELGHALSSHHNYTYDIELIEMEMEAWKVAQQISNKYNIEVDDNHIQDCLDTYRDWLHLRSTCPKCNSVSTQKNQKIYFCYNCHHNWLVTNTQLCRPYRLSQI